MTSLDDYAQFLTTRWDEAERRQLGRFCKWDSDHCDFAADCPDMIRADLAAKRAILDDAHRAEQAAATMRAESFKASFHAMLVVVRTLAAPFRDHPDHPANQEA